MGRLDSGPADFRIGREGDIAKSSAQFRGNRGKGSPHSLHSYMWRATGRHEAAEIMSVRVFAICCGWEDTIDHDQLRGDPALKMAVGRCPETGADLASQSTIRRFENAATRREAARLGGGTSRHLVRRA